MFSRLGVSKNSTAAGRTGDRVMAARPWTPAAVLSKNAVTVRRATGIGRSRTVALTTMPRTPSEPTNSEVRSSPVTPLMERWPTVMRLPSARTTSRARTDSRVTPYLAHRSPPALVAMLPPMEEMSKLAGSGA